MLIPTLDLIVAFFLVLGGTIWFGIWRNWEGKGTIWEDMPLALPWIALGLVILRIGILLRYFGVPIPGLLLVVVFLVCGIIGMWAYWVTWPDWILPPWYRELEDDEQEPQW